jgi:uncharacterized Zn finger protein
MDEETKIRLREEQTRLIKIVEALTKLDKSKEWSTLKELVFNKSLEAIERQIKVESLGETINTDKLYNLQGQWAWAKQFCDTDRFAETLKKQLEEIKKRL